MLCRQKCALMFIFNPLKYYDSHMTDTPDLSNLILRDAISDDIPKLAYLHLVTWNATYPDEPKNPGLQTRELQWKKSFETEHDWFCYVIENEAGDLVGFAKGRKERDGTGNLNKLFLMEAYQSHGLGTRLIRQVALRFYNEGIKSMWVVADMGNPTFVFYEKMGGVRKGDTDPEVAVYEWSDVSTLIKSPVTSP